MWLVLTGAVFIISAIAFQFSLTNKTQFRIQSLEGKRTAAHAAMSRITPAQREMQRASLEKAGVERVKGVRW